LTSVGVGAGWVGVALGTTVGGKGVELAVGVGAAIVGVVVGVRRPVLGLGFLQPMMLTNKHTSSKMTVRLFIPHSNLCCSRIKM